MDKSDSTLPFVTIIMPIRNEARFIKRSLEKVLAQDYPIELMEVLVVDGMSDDGTREVVQEMISEFERSSSYAGSAPLEAGRISKNTYASLSQPPIRFLDNPSRIVPAALNIGLQSARGDIIFRLDGHSEMAPDYVRKCTAKLQQRPDIECVGGPSVAVGEGLIGTAYAIALQSPFGVGGRTFRTLRTESYVDTLAFGCYRREVFDKLGGFDLSLQRNQDIEFSSRLTKAGFRMLLIPETETFYYAPDRVNSLVRQNYKNGYWNTKVLDKMAGVLSWRHFVPCIFVISLVVSIAASFLHPLGLYLFLLVGGSYIIVSLLATVSLALAHKQRAVLILPLLFPLMHISYGSGSLAGLLEYSLKALTKWKQRSTAL